MYELLNFPVRKKTVPQYEKQPCFSPLFIVIKVQFTAVAKWDEISMRLGDRNPAFCPWSSLFLIQATDVMDLFSHKHLQ